MPTAPKLELLTTEAAAELLGLKRQTLDTWRCLGRYNLPYVRLGRTIRYRRADLERFVEAGMETPGDLALAAKQG